ncbi:mas-related G-protein coupled receptor member H-like [Phascolarctos cinereus]|uniref:Mas-related G-protein coupled receptor member H-like n=1 Tax=Phascolarctos cinereus TaxID=38626 RepID=A0A6P5KB26_PHACI|nr:mas-related G-protein coupled receptor member H-like [Phascolarctos cinereus]
MEQSRTTLPTLESMVNTRSQVNASSLNSTSLEVILNHVSLFISLLGIVDNGLVIYFLLFHFKKTSFIVYILYLSIADLTFLVCTSIFIIKDIVYFNSGRELFRSQLFLFIFCILILFGYDTGLYLLTAISVERCLSVLYPIWYQSQRPKHQSAAVCVLLWALSIFVTWLEGFFCLQGTHPSFPTRPCTMVEVFLLILNFLVFAPLMVFASLTLFIKVFRNLKHHQPAKLYIIIITTVILFLVFAIPLRVLLMVYNFPDENDSFLLMLYLYLNLLSCINSTINPVVYFMVGQVRGKRTRKSLKDTLQMVFEDKPCSEVREKPGHYKIGALHWQQN